MKRHLLTAVLAAALVLAVLPLVAGPKKIVIGADLELTGAVATIGTSGMEGIQLAVEEQNRKGGLLGLSIELVVLDNKSNSTEAANQASKLITVKNAVAILGPMISSDCKAAAPIAQDEEVVLFSPSATNPAVTTIGPYIFRACFLDSFQGQTIAEFAAKQLKTKRMAILVENGNDYAKGLADYTKTAFTKAGGAVVAVEYFAKGEKDFSSLLTKIKSVKPDVIVVPSYYDTVALCVKQTREMGMKVPMMGGDGWDSPKMQEIAGAKNLNNTFYTNHYTSLDPVPKVQNFVKAYRARYHKMPDTLAALGYDTGYVLFDAIKRARSADKAQIRAALAVTANFQGVTGSITMGKDRNPIKSISVLELKDGKQTLRLKLPPKK